MADANRNELERLYQQLDELKRQNELYRVHDEISQHMRELDEYEKQYEHYRSSTPAKDGRRLRFDIPPGGDEDGRRASSPIDEHELQESVNDPDRFVTTRKVKQSPTKAPRKGVMMKPATFDGSGAWSDYKTHFEVCAKLNDWTDEQKGLYLSVFLRGHAHDVFVSI